MNDANGTSSVKGGIRTVRIKAAGARPVLGFFVLSFLLAWGWWLGVGLLAP